VKVNLHRGHTDRIAVSVFAAVHRDRWATMLTFNHQFGLVLAG
jgi:hypothetical protein